MIIVVADNPSMGATYRMPAALAPLAKDGRVLTVVKQLDGWREWGADYVLSNSVTRADPAPAWQMIESADWLLVMGITGLDVIDYLYPTGPPDEDLPPMVMYHVESLYRDERAAAFNLLAADIHDVAATFAMPDLWAGGQCPPGTVPLLQPMVVPSKPPVKPSSLTIVHTPGTDKKAIAKGSDRIRAGVNIARTSGVEKIIYKDVRSTLHADTLARKASAHICIDQVPPDGYPAGLGNSGCEGLALACLTISRYNVDTSAFFPNPPVVYAENAADVNNAILDYWQLSEVRRRRVREYSWSWAKSNLDLGGGPGGGSWLAYFRKHLPPAILERCM